MIFLGWVGGHSRMSQTRKFHHHASRGVFVRISLLEFGYKIRFITQKLVTSYFVYKNSRRDTRTNTSREAWWSNFLVGDIREEPPCICNRGWTRAGPMSFGFQHSIEGDIIQRIGSVWQEEREETLNGICGKSISVFLRGQYTGGHNCCLHGLWLAQFLNSSLPADIFSTWHWYSGYGWWNRAQNIAQPQKIL